MCAGVVIGGLGIIPLISFFGEFSSTVIFPAEIPVSEMGFQDIYDNYLKYIGAGAVAFGGIMGLIKTLPTIFSSFLGAVKGFKGQDEGEDRKSTRLNSSHV